MKKLSPAFIGLLQSAGVTLYCLAIAYLLENISITFPNQNSLIYGVLFLILFIASALITASMVFYYPLSLFLESHKEKNISLQIVLFTALWLIFEFTVVTIGFMIKG